MIYIASDKYGYDVLKYVTEYLDTHKISYENVGVQSANEDLKLEDMIPPFVEYIREDEDNKGILVCGTGIGVEIGANKFSGIRACLAANPQIAEWAGVYDKCNVVCLVGWDDDKEKAFAILDAWFNAEYDGDEGRLQMFEEFNTWH